jgi:hypothetical protein
MLGRLLEDLGVFAGVKKDVNNEAVFFQNINMWMLSQSGARWDNPDAVDYLLNRNDVLALVESHVRAILNSPRAIQFLGPRKFIRGGIGALHSPWGWKDPRNTFTLPLWLRIFPEAKVISIERHGVDVAQSLRARSLGELKTAADHYNSLGRTAFLHPKRDGFVDSVRCTSLEGGFSLWSAYQKQVSKMTASLPKERVHAMRYEDVLSNPEADLRSAAAFCGLEVSEEKFQEALASLKPDRAYSYLASPELTKFAIEHEDELSRFGYCAK